MKRRTIVLVSTLAVVLAGAVSAAIVLRPNGVQVGDCLSHAGFQSVTCDAKQNQLKVVSVGIVGCESANHMRILIKDRQSYCAVETASSPPPVVNEGDCVKTTTVSGTAKMVKAACTDTGTHKVIKKVTGSTKATDCPTTAPKALVSTKLNYVLCFAAPTPTPSAAATAQPGA
jgi:hypothetical protein